MEGHIPGEGRFSKRVGKEPQLEVVLGPSFPALDREPSYMLKSRLLLLTGKENKLRHLIPLWKLMNSVDLSVPGELPQRSYEIERELLKRKKHEKKGSKKGR